MGLQRRRFGQGALAWAGASALGVDAAGHAEPQLVRMAYSDSYEPFSWRGADGVPNGILVEAFDMLGKAGGCNFEHHAYPWARAQALVELGEADALCTLATKPRQAYALFCQEPVVVVQFGICHRVDDARPLAIRSIADMRQFRQGNYRGSGFARDYLEGERMQWDNDAQSVLRRIALGTLDITIEGELVTRAHLRNFGLEGQIRFTPAPFLPKSAYCFGLRRSYPDAPAVIKRMNSAISAARRSGALDALLGKYR